MKNTDNTRNNGMVLHLFKYLDSSMFDTEPLKNKDLRSSERTFLAFGNFDRICFSPVKRFIEFLGQSSSAHRWLGGRRDIMLYPLEADENRNFVFGQEDPTFSQPPFFMKENGNRCKRNFLMVSLLYVSGHAKASFKTYALFLDYIKNSIHRIVDAANKQLIDAGHSTITFEVYGTFNSSEIAILWGTDQFVDVQYLVEHIRHLYFETPESKKTVPAFISSYTIVSLYDKEITDPSQVRGGAMIQLVSSTITPDDQVREYEAPFNYLLKGTNESCIGRCAGKYDFFVEQKPKCLDLLLESREDENFGALNVDNEDYQKNFSCSNTRLFYRDEDLLEELKALQWSQYLSVPIDIEDFSSPKNLSWIKKRSVAGTEIDSVKTLFKDYRKEILSKIHPTSTFGCNLDLLFSDYIKCVNTSPDLQWSKDLKDQMKAAIQISQALLKQDSPLPSTLVNQEHITHIQKIFAILQKQIHHVSDAGKLFFEEPCSHSESTSQYDLLFHMYYGVVKYVLELVYTNRPELSSVQKCLIPLIRFEPVPTLTSELYFDITSTKQQLIDISIPQSAWCEPGHYVPLLIHELYHYVAPLKRVNRNDVFAKILTAELMTAAFVQFLKDARSLLQEQWSKDSVPSPSIIITSYEDDFRGSLVRISEFLSRSLSKYLQNTDVFTNFTDWDMQWNDFVKQFRNWYRNCTDESYVAFLSGCLNTLDSSISDFLNTPENQDLDKELCKIIANELELTACKDMNIKKIPHLMSLDEYQEYVQGDILGSLETQLREIFPDIAMTQLAKLGAVEYMLIFASFQDKTLSTPQKLRKSDCDLPLRVGFILNFILDSKESEPLARIEAFKGLKDDFQKKYVAYNKNAQLPDGETSQKSDEAIKASARRWFEYFEDQLDNYFFSYGSYNQLLYSLVQDCFVPLCSTKSTNPIQKCASSYFQSLSDNNQSAIFKSNIDFVHAFQVQPFFEDLTVPSDPTSSKNVVADTLHWTIPAPFDYSNPKTELKITVASEYSKPIALATNTLSKAHQRVFGTDAMKCKLWYRGSHNASFDILPSIMVHFLDKNQLPVIHNTKGVNLRGTMWEYQRSILEAFKSKADGSPEFINSASYTTSDYIALMQHYGQHTIYLDWSEDAYSALFFALESEIQQDTTKKSGDAAALYVFDPMLYNRARQMMIQRISQMHPETFCQDSSWAQKQAKDINNATTGYIPNLSMPYNRNRYGMFTLDIPANESLSSCRALTHLETSEELKKVTFNQFEDELWNLPLAVYTSRLNPRIRSQSGQFVAFSPFSLPVYTDSDNVDTLSADRFSYVSLLRIQDYFLEHFRNESPFMYEIKILAFVREELAEYLRKSGINRYRIYPELGNLGSM